MISKLFVEASAIAQPKISGIGHNAVEIVRALERLPDTHGISDIVLLVPYRGRKHIYKWGFKKVSIRYFMLPMKLFVILDRLRLMPYLDWFYGKGSYLFPNYLNLPVSAASRSYTYVHDIGFTTYPQFVSPRNRKYLRRNIPRWLKRTNRVITISEFSKQEIIKNYSAADDKVAVVPCGVDHMLYQKRSSTEVDKALQKYNIQAKDYILYVGNIEPRKNVAGLLEAYAGLGKDVHKAHPLLLIGGSGWLNESIDQLISDLGSKDVPIIRPDIYVEDEYLPAIYSGAAMLVHPAYYEGFGISPLQAMACEVPVIVANRASLPEVVGNSAITINPDDEQQLITAMNQILTDEKLRADMIAKGLLRSRNFTWQRAAKELMRVLQEKT